MRTKVLRLSLYFIVFYFFTNSISELENIASGKINLRWLTSSPALTVTSFLAFLSDALIAYLLFFWLYNRKGLLAVFLLYLIIAIPAMIGLRYIIQEVIGFRIFGVHNYYESMLNVRSYFLDNIWYALFYSLFGVVFFFIQYSQYNQLKQKEHQLEARNAELQFLRSQVNPHFLFNNLNNIYALVYQKSENALPAISRLSDLLRYMLYRADETVLLKEEMRYLQDYIDIHLMRYDHPVSMDLQLTTDQAHHIAPFLLIGFVENAFKHGSFRDPSDKLMIQAVMEGDNFIFEVRNRKNDLSKDVAGGIGLNNIKRRLDLLYGGRYDLTIHDETASFHIILKLKL